MERYQRCPKVTEIFPLNSVGIVTSRNHFVIDFDKEKLKRRIRVFRDENMADEVIQHSFHLKDGRNWKISEKRNVIKADNGWEEKIAAIQCSPFDARWIFYHDEVIERPRREVMRHMLHENIGLVTPRRVEVAGGWQHALVTSLLVEHVAVSLKTIDYLCPLYLYPDSKGDDLLDAASTVPKRKPNIDPALLQGLELAYNQNLTPEEIFSYVYAVLYAPMYRTQYAEFLRTDFPRVPFTRDRELFTKMAHIGIRLVNLHLLKSPELEPPIARFQGIGDARVEKPRYSDDERRVYINEGQYFEGVEPEVWEHQIGGYQVLDKWLKDRKGRILTLDDITHYCHVVTALAKTIEIQTEIDLLYPEIEKDVIIIERAS